MRRRRRLLVMVVPFALIMGLLSACQKPLPTITVFGGGHSVIVRAARFAFAGGPLHQPIKDVSQAPGISVRAGSELLVDVPRTVATNAWVVAAYTLDTASKAHPLAGAGSSTALRGQFSTHLSTTAAGVGQYYLQIAELRGTAEVGGWIVRVTTTD